MKAHGKGLGISINQDFTNLVNKWKQSLDEKPLPQKVFRPLKSWPAAPHPQQERLDEFHQVKSKFG